VLIFLIISALTLDGKPVAKCETLDFAAKNKPVPVLDAPDATPWKQAFDVLAELRACEYEQVKLRNLMISLRSTESVVVVDKKSKLVDGSTFVDFTVKDMQSLKLARDPMEPLGIAALDATSFKAVIDMMQALSVAGFTELCVPTTDLGKQAALATALGMKIADDTLAFPASAALLAAFPKAQQVAIASSTPPGWTALEAIVCTYDGRAVVWGVGTIKRTNGDLDWPTADNRARAAIAKLMGIEEIKGSRVIDHFQDATQRKSLVQLDAPDALKPAASTACPVTGAVVKWATKSITLKDLPMPQWSKPGVSLSGNTLMAKVDASKEDARLAADAGARALLASTIAEAALTVSKKLSPEQRACVAEIHWSDAFARIQVEPTEGAWIDVYELRKLAKKCPEAITAIVKEAAMPHACTGGKKTP